MKTIKLSEDVMRRARRYGERISRDGYSSAKHETIYYIHDKKDEGYMWVIKETYPINGLNYNEAVKVTIEQARKHYASKRAEGYKTYDEIYNIDRGVSREYIDKEGHKVVEIVKKDGRVSCRTIYC